MKEDYLVWRFQPIQAIRLLFFFITPRKVPKRVRHLETGFTIYELNENASKLLNPKLLLDLPWQPGPGHNGGVLKIGPDNNIYLTIGDIMRTGHNESQLYETQMQNLQNGKEADGRAGILRITQSGQPVGAGLIDDSYPLNLFYAYGIKNSFGIDFDPVTGNYGIQKMVLHLVTR